MKNTVIHGTKIQYTGQVSEGRIRKDSPKLKSIGSYTIGAENAIACYSPSKKKVTVVSKDVVDGYHRTFTVDGVPFNGI